MSNGAVIALIVFVLAVIFSNLYLIKKSAKMGWKTKASEQPPEEDGHDRLQDNQTKEKGPK